MLAIEEPNDAIEFHTGYVRWLLRQPDLKQPAEEIAKSNIGWCFGEGMSPERIAMWNEVCGASHPVFGAEIPSSEEAFKMGKAMAESKD